MPKNAIRFKSFDAASIGAGGFTWNVATIPERHKGVIHWMYLKVNVLFEWKLKINGIMDLEYGSINYANTEPTIDGWLMPLGNARIMLNGQDAVQLTLAPFVGAAQSAVYLIRGYYWPE